MLELLFGSLLQPVQPEVLRWSEESSRSYVRKVAEFEGWSERQWDCLDELIFRESSWNPYADNPKSSAYGLFQVLKTKPGTRVPEQVKAGFDYIKHRYDTPCSALRFHNYKGWY